MENINFKILLVEDEKVAQEAAIAILQQLNCQVDIAENGARALELFDSNRYWLVLLDLGLPDIDGLTVAEIIRERETEHKTPIIALTALADDDVRMSSVDVGVDEFIAKPLTVENISLVLEKFVAEVV